MSLRSFFSKLLNPIQVVVQPVYKKIGIIPRAEKYKAAELLKHYRHWVYVASSKNANAVAAVPLRLYVTTSAGQKAYPNLRKGIDTKPVTKQTLKRLSKNKNLAKRLTKAVMVEEVVDHPFLNLWHQVNQQMDGFEMLELLQLYMELTGDGYLWMQPNALGIPQTLWVLQSQHVTIVPGTESFIQGYLYGKSQADEVALKPEEVVHFRFTNPHNLFYGFSPLQGAFMAVKRKEDMDAYEDALLKNNARPDFLIKAQGRITPSQLKELRERWMNLYSQGKTGLPAVLDMDTDIKELGFTPRDMAFMKGHAFTREEILGAYGVPMSKVTTEKVNLANAEIGEIQYRRDTIVPRLNRIQDKLNQDAMPKYDERLFVAFDNPVPEDKEFKLKERESNLKNYVITINEAREEIGKEPVSWGNTPLVPLNILPLGSAPPEQQEEGKAVNINFNGNYPAEDAGEKQFYFDGVPKMQKIMASIFRRMSKEMAKKLEQQKALVPAGISEKGEAIPEWDEFMFEREKWAALINREMSAPIKAQLIRGGTRGMTQIGSGISFNVLNPEVQTFLNEYVFHFAAVVSRDVSSAYAATLARGFEAGESIPELTARTRTFFDGMSKLKAQQIARSESSRASHMGMIKSWQQSGIVEAMVWDAQADACPWCVEMDGKVVSLGQPFFEQGQSLDANFEDAEGNPVARSLKFDYEAVESPPLHPNCRCTLRAELKGD